MENPNSKRNNKQRFTTKSERQHPEEKLDIPTLKREIIEIIYNQIENMRLKQEKEDKEWSEWTRETLKNIETNEEVPPSHNQYRKVLDEKLPSDADLIENRLLEQASKKSSRYPVERQPAKQRSAYKEQLNSLLGQIAIKPTNSVEIRNLYELLGVDKTQTKDITVYQEILTQVKKSQGKRTRLAFNLSIYTEDISVSREKGTKTTIEPNIPDYIEFGKDEIELSRLYKEERTNIENEYALTRLLENNFATKTKEGYSITEEGKEAYEHLVERATKFSETLNKYGKEPEEKNILSKDSTREKIYENRPQMPSMVYKPIAVTPQIEGIPYTPIDNSTRSQQAGFRS